MDSLAIWSGIALVTRLAALSVLLYVARIQFNQFQYKTALQPLKRLLFYLVIAIFITEVPIIYLNLARVFGQTGTSDITDVATGTNAVGLLLTALLLLAVYKYKGDN